MSIHKLTSGDGYAYLTRQVSVLDATDKQHTGLADYYSQRGESPGRWTGSALADVDMAVGQEVTADQMASLFAEGRHPNADRMTADLIKTGASTEEKGLAIALGKLTIMAIWTFQIRMCGRSTRLSHHWLRAILN
jgi:hypothetical protein